MDLGVQLVFSGLMLLELVALLVVGSWRILELDWQLAMLLVVMWYRMQQCAPGKVEYALGIGWSCLL